MSAGAPLLLAALLAGWSTASQSFEFENVTNAVVDQTASSSYRFDAVWTDFNGDGCYDPFIFDHNNSTTSRLWLHSCNSDRGGTFSLRSNNQVSYYISSPSWVLGSGWMTVLDFDGDGRQDFWLRHANTPAGRYLNGGNSGSIPTFSEKQYGCDDRCVFADINGDGNLDVVRSDVAVEEMISRDEILPPRTSRGYVTLTADLNNDSWTDIVQPGRGGVWQNAGGQLTWRNTGFEGGMIVAAVADVDNDGDLDFFSYAGSAETDGGFHGYRNDGNFRFTEMPMPEVGFQSYYTNYGNLVAADLDNDTHVDLVISGAPSASSDHTVLRNNGGWSFTVETNPFGRAGGGNPWQAAKARSSIADYDNDGRLDVLVTQINSNLAIFRNTTTSGNQWSRLRFQGSDGNSQAAGATATWYANGSQQILAHQHVVIDNQHAMTELHAGLGNAQIFDLEVTFPNGGDTFRYEGLTPGSEFIIYTDGCLLSDWSRGEEIPRDAPAGCEAGGAFFRSGFER